MLPGKKYTAEDVLRILRRRYWLLLVPFAVVSAVTAVIARRLPNVYMATTTIAVVPAQVSENLVKQSVTTRLDGRLEAIQQQVLSRTRLEKIIDDFNLYPQARRTGLMEDVVAQMRRDTSVQVVKGDAFTVTYVGDDPKTVQKVTQRIATLFIDQNLLDRASLAEGTNQFLEVQLENARHQLEEKEKALEAYRMKYAGQLPSQAQSNLQALQNVQMQVQAILESRDRDREQRLVLQQQLADLQPEAAASVTPTSDRPTAALPPDPSAVASQGGTTAQQLQAAKDLVKVFELRYKPGEPDLDRAKRLVDTLQQKLDAEALAQPVSSTPDQSLTPAEQQRRQRVGDLQAQIAQIDTRLTASQADEKRLRDKAADLQQKIDAVPARESDMTALTRDYSVLQNTYSALLQRKQDANIAANMEKQQIGEQFNIVEEAQIPQRPISPNRPAITYFAMAAGLGIGLVLVVLTEYRSTGFQTDDEVTRLLALPVLAVVPFMESAPEHKRAIYLRSLREFCLGTTVTASLAVLVYTLVR